MQPIQNLQLGGRPSKAQYQYILQSVQRRRAQRLGAASCRSRCAPTRCSATSPATRSCAACRRTLKIDRDRPTRSASSIDDIRTALYSAFGERQVSTIYTAGRQLPGDHGGRARTPSRTRARSTTSTCAASTGALVPLSSFATVERTVGPTVDQPRRPAAGGDGVVQPRARRARSATRRRRSSRYRDQIRMPAVDHHQLRRRCGGVQELAGQPGDPDHRRRCSSSTCCSACSTRATSIR